jgi:hypothetical protein
MRVPACASLSQLLHGHEKNCEGHGVGLLARHAARRSPILHEGTSVNSTEGESSAENVSNDGNYLAS